MGLDLQDVEHVEALLFVCEHWGDVAPAGSGYQAEVLALAIETVQDPRSAIACIEALAEARGVSMEAEGPNQYGLISLCGYQSGRFLDMDEWAALIGRLLRVPAGADAAALADQALRGE